MDIFAIVKSVDEDDVLTFSLLTKDMDYDTTFESLNSGLTLIQYLCIQNRPAFVDVLLAYGADPNKQNEKGWVALHYACAEGGNSSIAESLILHGAFVNMQSENKATPLHCAASAGSLACVDILLEHGAKMSLGPDGLTPLHCAVQANKPDVVERLIKAGANIDEPDITKCTSLHLACLKSLYDCAQILINNGADTSLKEANGCKPYQLAIDIRILDLLKTPK